MSAVLVLPHASAFALEIHGAAVVFASAAEARQFLQTKDEFTERVSAFDRSALMKVDRRVSRAEFLRFLGESALAWTPEEQTRLSAIIAGINERVAAFTFSLPARVLLIKTSGREEAHAPYTRRNAIILPLRELAKTEDLERLLCHELFHIISRSNPALRERLYASIGFTRCAEAVLPAEIEARRMTNPDALRNNHFIRVQVDGKQRVGMPIIFSKSARYDAARGGEFFDYLRVGFLVAENVRDLASRNGPSKQVVHVDAVSGFFEQVGRNTEYIIHPEEILGDNFALLALEKRDVPSPEVLARIESVLRQRD